MPSTPAETIIACLAKYIGEPTAVSTVNVFCRRTVGVEPKALNQKQLMLVLPSLRPVLQILMGTTRAEQVLTEIQGELSK